MCGRTAQGLAPAQIREQLEKTLPSKPAESWIGEDKYRTSYNVAPTRYQPIVRADPKTNSYVVHLMRWGLIPRHSKSMPDYSSVLKSINARDDSLFMGPTGKAMFYEWRRRGKERVPFYTKRRDGNLMLMAAIYDVAQIQGSEEPLYTYATITTDASPQLDWLHDRMPVLIPNHDHDKIRMWLDPNLKWNATLEAMLKPCDEFTEIKEESTDGGDAVVKSVYALETYQVDERVNKVQNDSPDFAKPWNSTANKKTLNRFFMSKAPSGDASPATITSKKEISDEDGGGGQSHRSEEDDYELQSDARHEAEVDFKPEASDDERMQEQVSVSADDSQRDAGFAEQGVGNISATSDQEKEEDEDLKLALELSRQDRGRNDRTTTSAHNDAQEPDVSPKAALDNVRTRVTSPGSVDLLEKRRKELQDEDEEMKKVLELSLLEAIADGHDDVSSTYDHAASTRESVGTDELARKEQEELERAIAASLDEAEGSSEPLFSQQSSTSSTTSAPKALKSPRSQKASTSAPTTPKKRKPSITTNTQPASTSKKGKPSQDSKITSFFQHTNPP
ncbi:hypothetical protein BGZ58_002362 [Dissophora ornata]|nr:hypothetical protein BGZ58_002362 [Dissophora ornata]